MLVKNTRNSLPNAFHITLSGTTLNVRPKFFFVTKVFIYNHGRTEYKVVFFEIPV